MFKKLNRLIELFAKFVTMYYKLSTEAVCFYDQNFCLNYEQNILKKSREVWILERKRLKKTPPYV